ncbi:hypothetical protein G7Z17_g5588 [Cylindrodendrum hubeiense]|uniref:Ribosomal protein S21 n=1 Tax=Cylindrodendrum hubeiense TaxID=595255 RepID=A0A9P5LBL6_9HYPO|nr:hypothetical protein G7Z17_g5588 [Cylindrodendrum hubeiense]
MIGSRKIRPRPYRTNVNPAMATFLLPQLITCLVHSARATTPRLGSAMLSRLSAPTTLRTSSRAFSTSIALRAGPNDNSRDAPAPKRLNPLVGNASRRQPTEREPAPRARIPMTPKSMQPQQPVQTSPEAGMPPPPPAPESLLSNIELKKGEQHPYTASRTATPFNLDIASIIANKNVSFGQGISADPMARPRVRAKAVTGRTVFVRDRMTPTSGPTPMIALRVLNKMVREQQVKTKFHSQKFHERKGLKKKRLRSQRWRTRFKSGFKATVNRVLELKRQGW